LKRQKFSELIVSIAYLSKVITTTTRIFEYQKDNPVVFWY